MLYDAAGSKFGKLLLYMGVWLHIVWQPLLNSSGKAVSLPLSLWKVKQCDQTRLMEA